MFHVQVMEDVHLLRSREHVEPIPTSKSPSIDVKLTQPHWLDVGRHLQQVYRHCIADKVCFPCYCKVYGHKTMQWVHTYIQYINRWYNQCLLYCSYSPLYIPTFLWSPCLITLILRKVIELYSIQYKCIVSV